MRTGCLPPTLSQSEVSTVSLLSKFILSHWAGRRARTQRSTAAAQGTKVDHYSTGSKVRAEVSARQVNHYPGPVCQGAPGVTRPQLLPRTECHGSRYEAGVRPDVFAGTGGRPDVADRVSRRMADDRKQVFLLFGRRGLLERCDAELHKDGGDPGRNLHRYRNQRQHTVRPRQCLLGGHTTQHHQCHLALRRRSPRQPALSCGGKRAIRLPYAKWTKYRQSV